MMKYSGLITLVSVNVFATVTFADEGQRLLDQFFSNTKTMEANFSQSLRSNDGELLQESKGQFYLQKPGKFRWNYTEPYAQQIVSDGINIWVYDVDLQQVTVQKQSTTLANTPMALIQDKKLVEQAFDIRSLDKTAGVYRMLLVARSDTTDFKRIILGVDEKGLRFIQLKDLFDQSTDIIFSDIKINHDIDASTFVFIAPEGTDVFDGS